MDPSSIDAALTSQVSSRVSARSRQTRRKFYVNRSGVSSGFRICSDFRFQQVPCFGRGGAVQLPPAAPNLKSPGLRELGTASGSGLAPARHQETRKRLLRCSFQISERSSPSKHFLNLKRSKSKNTQRKKRAYD